MMLRRRFMIAMVLASTLGLAAPASAQNVVEVAASTGQFDTLIAAAKAAGLADDLATASPITVFAPTDAAFAKLPRGTVKALLKPENRRQLRAILSYHVLPAKVLAQDVPHKPTFVKTLNPNDTVRVVRRGKRVHVDRSRVIKANVKAQNGIIHVIDRVLMPGKAH